MKVNPTEFDWIPSTKNVDGNPQATGECTGYTIGIRSLTAAGSAAGTYPILIPVTDPSATKETFSAAYAAGLALLKDDTYQSSVREESKNGPSSWAPETTGNATPNTAPFGSDFQISTSPPAAPTSFTVA